MAKRLPLPHRNDLPEMVLFHREHPSEPMVILQVPNEGRTDSETYVIDLEDSTHRMWVEDLPNSRELRDKMSVAQHIAFSPRTGHVQEVEDLDQIGEMAMMFADARSRAAAVRTPVFERLAIRRRTRDLPGVSLLRQMLGGGRA